MRSRSQKYRKNFRHKRKFPQRARVWVGRGRKKAFKSTFLAFDAKVYGVT